MVLRRVAPHPDERDPATRSLLADYESVVRAESGRGFRELIQGQETLLARGDVRGNLWVAPHGEPAGLALWDFVPGVGRRVRIYLDSAHRTPEDLVLLLEDLEARSEHEGSVASVVDYIPGIPRDEQERTFTARGFFPVERLVLRLLPDVPIPDESLAGRTDLRPLEASDEEALVGLMRESYDQLAGEAAPWLFYRDPRQDARDAVREIVEGRRGEWLTGASFGLEVGGALRGASLVSRLDVPILSEVMVSPSFRKIGIGYALALGSVRALRDAGHEVVETVTTSHDLRALRLCRRIGFEPADVSAIGLWVSRVAVGVPPPRRP